jgi:hypothetical protein
MLPLTARVCACGMRVHVQCCACALLCMLHAPCTFSLPCSCAVLCVPCSLLLFLSSFSSLTLLMASGSDEIQALIGQLAQLTASVSQLQTSVAAASSLPIHVQLWDVMADTADAAALRTVHWLAASGYDGLRAAVAVSFAKELAEASDEVRPLFKLYYHFDHPRQQVKVEQATLQAFLQHKQLAPGTLLFLFVPVLLGESKKSSSPLKPPQCLTVDLSPSPLSPSSAYATTFSSDVSTPAEVRHSSFRCAVLSRDSHPCTEFTPGNELVVWMCVFCGGPFSADSVEAAHMIPHAPSQHRGLLVDSTLYRHIGASIHSTRNGITLCLLCHKHFDTGALWAEAVAMDGAAAAAGPTDESFRLRLRVLDRLQQEKHLSQFCTGDGVYVRIPPVLAERVDFPLLAVWQWRQQWALCPKPISAVASSNSATRPCSPLWAAQLAKGLLGYCASEGQ